MRCLLAANSCILWSGCPWHLPHPSSVPSFHAARHTMPTLVTSTRAATGPGGTASYVTWVQELSWAPACVWWSGRRTGRGRRRIRFFLTRWPSERVACSMRRWFWWRCPRWWASVGRRRPRLICYHRRFVTGRRPSSFVAVTLACVRKCPG